MNVRLQSLLPDWAIVVLISAAVGAISAVVAVAVYRESLVASEGPLPVPSESADP